MPKEDTQFIGRRQILGGACAAIAGLALPSTSLATTWQPSKRPELAVLVPSFTRQPLLVEQYLNGLTLALDKGGRGSVQLRLVPYQGHTRQVAHKIETLLRESPPDVITGLFSPDVGAMTGPLLQHHKVPMLVCDLGADRLPSIAHNPMLAGQSLELASTNAALGIKAPSQLGSRAVLAIGMAESGHDFPTEFRRTFEDHGGTVLATHVSGVPGRASEFQGLQEALHSHEPDFVMAFFAGPQRQRFDQMMNLTGLGARTAVVTMDLDRTAFAPRNGLSNTAVGSWLHGPAQCDRFQRACSDANVQTSAFTVLGFEAGERIRSGLDSTESGVFIWPDQTVGPRGIRDHRASCMACHGGSWIVTGQDTSTELATPPLHLALQHQFSLEYSRLPSSGWINSYLFN